MSLNPGTRLGPYEIASRLGSGGMGEVYRAIDTRLARTVAIKVLSDHLASDARSRERFEREARAISGLNHPHVCTLYDVGEDGDTRYLVMEFVDGETLEARLGQGRLPLEEALAYAIQIADALDKAHRQGIVHRDLKPANIMLTASGAKLLDFGLAKLKGGAGPVTPYSQLTTETGLTADGVILGTMPYMAPEQLEGREADARADIFAFGAVVYEMVTGKRAFEGTSAANLIGAIMSSDPGPMAELQPATPQSIDHLIARCLAKAADDRWQTASDLMRELQWVAQTREARKPEDAAAPSRRQLHLAWLSTLIAIGLGLGAVVFGLRSSREAAELRLEVSTPPTSRPEDFALSPDGRKIVFVADGQTGGQLWLRSLDAEDPEPLPGTDGASRPFWSPDGGSVAFFSGIWLKVLDIGGRQPQEIARAPVPGGGTWGRDGTILFAPTPNTGLFRVAETGGEASAVTELGPDHRGHVSPRFLPDGRQFLFFADGAESIRGIYIASLDSPGPVRLVTADSPGDFQAPDRLIHAPQGRLQMQRIDLRNRALTGAPVTMAEEVAAFSASDSGTVAYRRVEPFRSQLTWYDREGTEKGTLGPEYGGGSANPHLSPDGKSVVVNLTVQDNTDIYTIRDDEPNQFTFDPGADSIPVWSAEGNWIFFRSTRNGPLAIFRKLASGIAEEEEVLELPGENLVPMDVSPDGRWLLYLSVVPNGLGNLWRLALDGSADRFPFLVTDYAETFGEFSPNGRWVAYASDESGAFEVYVRSFPDPGAPIKISTAGGGQARWAPSGSELYYIAADGWLTAVPLTVEQSTLRRETPQRLFPTGITSLLNHQYDVTADGRFLLEVRQPTTSPLTLLLNWQPHQ